MNLGDRLGLGTAQWGMPYGINNKIGQATDLEVKKLITSSVENNLIIDTAWSYGKSETIIGRHLKCQRPQIVTKTKPIKFCSKPVPNSTNEVLDDLHKSIETLGGPPIYGVLVHHVNDLLSPCGESLWKELVALKKTGVVKKIGCSLYNPNDFCDLSKRFSLDLVQTPLNVFDQRYLKSGLAQAMREGKVEVHLRSIFLQGLLLFEPTKLPPGLVCARLYLEAFKAIVDDLNIKAIHACLQFALQTTTTERLILGCETYNQWCEMLSFAYKPLNQNQIEKMHDLAIDDPRVINPSLWQR